MLRALRGGPWCVRPPRCVARGVVTEARKVPQRWAPLALRLFDAAQTPTLNAHAAEAICTSVVQDTQLQAERTRDAPLSRDSLHGNMLRALLTMKAGSVKRDVLVSEMLRAMWTNEVPLAPQVLAHVAVLSGVRGMQRTRALLHRHVLGHGADEAVWRALIDAHAMRGDWARVDEALAVVTERGMHFALDAYRYAFIRMQRDTPTAALPAAVHSMIQQMRDDGVTLDDAVLVELIRALVAPVQRAHAARATRAELVRLAAPAHALLDGFFRWLCALEEPARLRPYRHGLAALLLAQMDTVAAWQPARGTQPNSSIHARLGRVAEVLRGPDGLYESVRIQIDAASGPMDAALARLSVWIASAPNADAARLQRKTVLALFSRACRMVPTRRLAVLLHLMRIASRPALWTGVASKALPRLWQRLLHLWARSSPEQRLHTASTHTGWPALSIALPLLEGAAASVAAPQSSWAAVVDHPRRCRAMVWAACCAEPLGDTESRLRQLDQLFVRLHAPPRVRRWAESAAHDAKSARRALP